MTRPFNIPSPGAPLVGLSKLLSGIAETANRDDMPAAGTFGGDGTNILPTPQVSIGLFQVTSRWSGGSLPDGLTWPLLPDIDQWQWAAATRVEYYPDTAAWNTPSGADDDVTVPENIYLWHQAGLPPGSVDPDRDLPEEMQTAGDFVPAVGVGQWIWCFYDEGPGCWVALQPFEDILRVKLTSDWYACGTATADILISLGDADEWMGFDTGCAIVVYDPVGIIANAPAAVQSTCSGSSGQSTAYIPAGTIAIVKRFADTNAWEPLGGFGSLCASSSSGSSGSSSSGACAYPVIGPAENYPGFQYGIPQLLGKDENDCWLWYGLTQCTSSSSGA